MNGISSEYIKWYKVVGSKRMSMSVSVSVSSFNASIQVTELLMKTLENVAKDLASRCIRECSQRHGFNADEEIRILGLENLALIRKQMAKKSVSKKEKKPRSSSSANKEKKSVFPMPFIPENVDINGCQGLAYNRGLFTQCSKMRMESGNFCKGCQTEADKNASGCPDCGTVDNRMANGLYEFKDPKGRSPISYLKVLEKLKLTKEAAIEEAGKSHSEIPNEHFVVLEKSKKSKGRPSKVVKKTGAVEADNVSDLFAKLSSEDGDIEINDDESEDKPVKASKKLSDEEKEAKKAVLEQERAIKKAEREAKLASEKEEREAKRKAEAEQKKAEREAKVVAEKAEREAKRQQEKDEREAKKAAEKAAKEAEKANKSSKVVKKPEAPPAPAVDAKPAPEAKPQGKVSVTRIQIGGKAYLKSSTNILYDPITKEEVGIWDPETKTIKDLPDEESDEEEEEQYEDL